MYPVLDTNHAAEAQAHLTDHYRNKIVIPGVLKSFMASVQELENVFWDIINKFLLVNSPTGDQLRQIGRLVGAQYHGETDAQYLQLVKIQIRVNRSQGLSEDIIQIMDLWLGAPAPTYLDFEAALYFTLQQYVNGSIPSLATLVGNPRYLSGASFLVEGLNVTYPLGVASSLSHARSAGTRGELRYSTWAPGNDVVLTSVTTAPRVAAGGGWGSVSSSSTGGLLLASVGT